GPDNVVVQSIDNYMSNPPAGADPNIVLEALTRIKIPKGRPMWQQRLKMWANRLGNAKDADKPEKGSS
ncbi:MAG: hypothetical protein NTX52_01420, partial [Planctomycetota bacterium]|nr:hypothetical protein [Planctomycetota bacterium]